MSAHNRSYMHATPEAAMELARLMVSSTTHDELVQAAQAVQAAPLPGAYVYVKLTPALSCRVAKVAL